MEISELEKQVLKQEYPQLSLSEDIDIERYFELRKMGYLNEALILYNGKLKRKYPEDSMRYELMSAYRQKTSRFQELLTQNLIQLAQKTISQIKQVIEFITQKISNLDMNDVYNVVQECEKIVSAVSSDRFASISFTEKYARYAGIIGYKEISMKKSAELIRLYVTDTLSSVKAYKDEQSALLSQENRKKNAYKPPESFDFSKIVFTQEQIDSIIIPDTIKIIEDQVIAYTLKYWLVYSNAGFENIVLLYSRKYKTNHFNIFQAVKIGRFRNWKDEEILQAVLLNLVNGYYYSISGDLYIQREWAKMKISIEPIKNNEESDDNDFKKDTSEKKSINKDDKSLTSNKREKNVSKKEKSIKEYNSKKQEFVENNNCKEQKEQAAKETKSKNSYLRNQKKKIKNETKEVVSKEYKIEIENRNSIESSRFEMNTTASISEIIKHMTGEKYQIHRGLFFDGIRSSIRKELEKSIIQKISMFGHEQNDAENYIYDFFDENYDNPYQNWSISDQRVQVLKLGFDIISLEPIIADWIARSKL